MSFVNTLPYVSNPIEEFSNFSFVSWEKEIYPRFKGGTKEEEISFFKNIIVKNKLKGIIDFGVGGGAELSGIISEPKKSDYVLNSIEANEVDEEFIKQAMSLFEKSGQDVVIHKSNWMNLPLAEPSYTHSFDFGFLTGNSVTSSLP